MQFKLTFIDWRGREKVCFIFAKNINQATKDASIMQGLTKIISIKEIQ